MASSMSDGSSMICRMNDDGNIRIPGSAMNQMDRGWAGLGIYNADTGWALGPDGLPVRLQVFSGSSTVGGPAVDHPGVNPRPASLEAGRFALACFWLRTVRTSPRDPDSSAERSQPPPDQ